jgi:hypothetical protein
MSAVACSTFDRSMRTEVIARRAAYDQEFITRFRRAEIGRLARRTDRRIDGRLCALRSQWLERHGQFWRQPRATASVASTALSLWKANDRARQDRTVEVCCVDTRWYISG